MKIIKPSSIVQHKTQGWYGLVRMEGDNGRISVKSIEDDTPSSFHLAGDFVLASSARVPWFKPNILRHINGTELLYWKLPSGDMVCEDESVWFSGEYAVSMRISQAD
jgi:hypothetical protein